MHSIKTEKKSQTKRLLRNKHVLTFFQNNHHVPLICIMSIILFFKKTHSFTGLKKSIVIFLFHSMDDWNNALFIRQNFNSKSWKSCHTFMKSKKIKKEIVWMYMLLQGNISEQSILFDKQVSIEIEKKKTRSIFFPT